MSQKFGDFGDKMLIKFSGEDKPQVMQLWDELSDGFRKEKVLISMVDTVKPIRCLEFQSC